LLHQVYNHQSPVSISREITVPIYIFQTEIPKLYRKLGFPQKAFEATMQLKSLRKNHLKRYGKKGIVPGRDKTIKYFVHHASMEHSHLGWYLLPGEYNIEEYTYARDAEYAIADKISLQIVAAILMTLIIGSAFCYLLVKWRLKKNIKPWNKSNPTFQVASHVASTYYFRRLVYCCIVTFLLLVSN
jgi:hypothetical protein